MKKILTLILIVVMVSAFGNIAMAQETQGEWDASGDYKDYLWELTDEMDDEEFLKLAIRNFKFIQSVEPLVDEESFHALYLASVHLKQKKEGSRQEFLDAQNNLNMKLSIADGVYFLWEKDNIPSYEDEGLTDEKLDAAPLDGVGFIPLLVKYLLDDPSQAKGNIVACAGGAGSNRSNSSESYPAAEVFNELGYNVFVLQYRIAPYSRRDMAMDAQRAVRMVRYYAEKEGWGGQDMIAGAGWSAGATTIMNAVNYCYGDMTPDVYDPSYIPDEIDMVNSDMDAAMPIYGGRITDDCENPKIPALFCCLGTEDQNHTVEDYTANPYQAGIDRGAPATILIIEGAGHGFGVGQEGAIKSVPECALWPAQADIFMQENLGHSHNLG